MMKAMIDKTLIYVFGLLTLVMIMLAFLDTRDAYRNPDIYQSVYKVTIDEYVQRNYKIVAIGVITLLVCMLRLFDKKHQTIWRIVFYCVLIAVAGTLVYGYFQWAATGFDH